MPLGISLIARGEIVKKLEGEPARATQIPVAKNAASEKFLRDCGLVTFTETIGGILRTAGEMDDRTILNAFLCSAQWSIAYHYFARLEGTFFRGEKCASVISVLSKIMRQGLEKPAAEARALLAQMAGVEPDVIEPEFRRKEGAAEALNATRIILCLDNNLSGNSVIDEAKRMKLRFEKAIENVTKAALSNEFSAVFAVASPGHVAFGADYEDERSVELKQVFFTHAARFALDSYLANREVK